MKRNKKLLLKAAERIEQVPESYDQYTFSAHSSASPCGTVACLAGEILIVSESTVERGLKKLWASNCVSRDAEKLAHFTHEEGNALFGFGGGWPQPFRTKFMRARTQKTKAKIAAALLRYLAEGGTV